MSVAPYLPHKNILLIKYLLQAESFCRCRVSGRLTVQCRKDFRHAACIPFSKPHLNQGSGQDPDHILQKSVSLKFQLYQSAARLFYGVP